MEKISVLLRCYQIIKCFNVSLTYEYLVYKTRLSKKLFLSSPYIVNIVYIVNMLLCPYPTHVFIFSLYDCKYVTNCLHYVKLIDCFGQKLSFSF